MKRQLRWTGHVIRMGSERLPKTLLYGEILGGQRNRGGQRKRFKDAISISLRRCNITRSSFEETAADRVTFAAAVRNGARHAETHRTRHREALRARCRLRHQQQQQSEERLSSSSTGI